MTTRLEIVSLDGKRHQLHPRPCGAWPARAQTMATVTVSLLENQFADAVGNQNEAAADLITVTVKDQIGYADGEIAQQTSDTGSKEGSSRVLHP